MAKKLARVIGRMSDADKARHAQIIAAVKKEFPPKHVGRQPAAPGIGAAIRAAREAKGMSWYAVAQQAGIPNQGTIRDIELGRDVKVSSLQAVAKVLGLEVELVAARS